MNRILRLALCAITLFVALASASTVNAQIVNPNGYVARLTIRSGLPSLMIDNPEASSTQRCLLVTSTHDGAVGGGSTRDSICAEQELLVRVPRARWANIRSARNPRIHRSIRVANNVLKNWRSHPGPIVERLNALMQTVGDLRDTLVQNRTLNVACNGLTAATCLPTTSADSTANTSTVYGINEAREQHAIRAVHRVRLRLVDNQNNALCNAVCMIAADRSYCVEHRLGTITAVEWALPYTDDGRAPLCQPDDRQPQCQRRPVQALTIFSCESLAAWHRNVRTTIAEREDRRSAQREHEDRVAAVNGAIVNGTPPAQEVVDIRQALSALRGRLAGVEARLANLIHPAAEATPPAATAPAAAPTPPAARTRSSARAARPRRRHAAHSGRRATGLPSWLTCHGPRGGGHVTCRADQSDGNVHEVFRYVARTVPMAVRAAVTNTANITRLPLSHRLLPDVPSRHLDGAIAALIAANMGNPRRECSSPVYATCRDRQGRPLSRRRLGVCPVANGGSTLIDLQYLTTAFAATCHQMDFDLVPGMRFRIPVGSARTFRGHLSRGSSGTAEIAMTDSSHMPSIASVVAVTTTVASLATPAPSGWMSGSPNRVEPPPPASARLACDILRRETCIPPCLVAADAAFNRIRTAAALGRRPRTFLAA